MKTLSKTLVVEAALAGFVAAALVSPVCAQDAAKKEGKDMPKAGAAKKGKKAAGMVHCFGVNACKGQSECAVEGKTSCKGQNTCKAQGWVSLAKKACKDQGGTVMGAKKKAAPAPAAAPAAAPVQK